MAFSRVLGIIHLDMLSSIHVRHFWKWEKVSHSSWVLSQLIGWIFILELFIDNSCNSAYFPRLITLELPKSPYSNYLKLTSARFCGPLFNLGTYILHKIHTLEQINVVIYSILVSIEISNFLNIWLTNITRKLSENKWENFYC